MAKVPDKDSIDFHCCVCGCFANAVNAYTCRKCGKYVCPACIGQSPESLNHGMPLCNNCDKGDK
jgi:hypothetical protein